MKLNRILGILDPLEGPLQGPNGPYDLRKDTSHLLLREFDRRSHPIFLAAPSDLAWKSGQVAVHSRRVRVLDGAPYFRPAGPSLKPATDFDLILMRKDPPVDATYLQATQLLARIPETTWVCNSPSALARWNEKLVILEFPRWIPPTVVSANADVLGDFARKNGLKVVLKDLTGFGGRGTKLATLGTPGWKRVLSGMTRRGALPIMAQAFLPAIARGEKRIFLIDGHPLGAILRIPVRGNFLANPDLGASIHPTRLNSKEKNLCRELGRFLRKNGVFFAGVDVIDGRLTEINITSPGMLWEWNEADGKAHERELVDLFEMKMKKRAT